MIDVKRAIAWLKVAKRADGLGGKPWISHAEQRVIRIGRLKVRLGAHGKSDSWMGRFGGGWSGKLGIEWTWPGRFGWTLNIYLAVTAVYIHWESVEGRDSRLEREAARAVA